MKYKIGDKVRYLKNTTDSDAIVGEKYYITKIGLNNTSYLLGKEKGILALSMWVEESNIELIEEKQQKYVVYVDGKNTPKKEYIDIEEAKKEAKRLAKKERKKSFVFELKAKYEIEIKEFNY